MKTLNILLDKAKETCSLNSDAGLARKIGVSPTAVNDWRHKKTSIKDEHLRELAHLAKVDEGEWFVAVKEELATNKREKAMWGSLSDRLRAAAAVMATVALLVGSALANPLIAKATSLANPLIAKANSPGLYIMLNAKRPQWRSCRYF